MFTPDDDMSSDGEIHAEAACDTATAGLACLCGSAADGIAALDEHLARVFTPDDGIGRDGGRHASAASAPAFGVLGTVSEPEADRDRALGIRSNRTNMLVLHLAIPICL